MPVDIVILAAGKGTRMKSDMPKVLHRLAGRSLLAHVLETAQSIEDASISIVTGHGAEAVQAEVHGENINWVEQLEQLGTAHAVQQAIPYLSDTGKVLILYGDVPLLSADTARRMLRAVEENTLALLTVDLDDPNGYGRIIRDENGEVTAIVEQKDASAEQRAIKEINTGVLALESRQLHRWLSMIGNANAQGEYYLTDIIAIARREGCRIETLNPAAVEEIEGVNTREQLSYLERYYQRQQAAKLMANGVTLSDPARFDSRGNITCGTDIYIDINCVLEGNVSLGNGVRIGPNCVISEADIGDNAVIKANTVIEGPVTVGAGVEIGPFARLRPGTEMADGAKIGNFVETKQARVGAGSKINHLSYVGDATLGENVNVGAGTITCNYDGANKFRTDIGDGAFIGSNSALVAPVKIGRGATVGAGSTVTEDVPEDNLTVARGKQRNIEGWKRPAKQVKDSGKKES